MLLSFSDKFTIPSYQKILYHLYMHFVHVRFILVIRQFRVTIAKKCGALTRCIDVGFVVVMHE